MDAKEKRTLTRAEMEAAILFTLGNNKDISLEEIKQTMPLSKLAGYVANDLSDYISTLGLQKATSYFQFHKLVSSSAKYYLKKPVFFGTIDMINGKNLYDKEPEIEDDWNKYIQKLTNHYLYLFDVRNAKHFMGLNPILGLVSQLNKEGYRTRLVVNGSPFSTTCLEISDPNNNDVLIYLTGQASCEHGDHPISFFNIRFKVAVENFIHGRRYFSQLDEDIDRNVPLDEQIYDYLDRYGHWLIDYRSIKASDQRIEKLFLETLTQTSKGNKDFVMTKGKAFCDHLKEKECLIGE